ncbi:MAG: gamma-glutamyltransferase family protein [Oscillospiraceae bacterium]|jgi:gamma-glutamyltranspeptidase/glutathione hydrolase
MYTTPGYPNPSRRSLICGTNGMVCTSQPLAAQAGLAILRQGGNAIDAAIATAACMTVVEPTSNGLGSDAFALVWTRDKLHGLNASGRYPRLGSLAALKARGYDEMPMFGWMPVMVPGAPSAWAELSAKFGRLRLEDVLAPAIAYAEEGYPISPVIARQWRNYFEAHKDEFSGNPCFQPWFDTFAPNGRTPEVGKLWRSSDHAASLRSIAATGAKAFYQGELADKIDAFSRETGGFLRKEDLADYWCEWVEPLRVGYRGYEVCEIPPNGHGIVTLMALNILNGMDITSRDDAETVHRQLEAMKLAFTDGKRYIADPAFMTVTPEQLLSSAYAATRRREIGQTACMPAAGDPHCGDTIYLCTADKEGNMVSYIQSNYCDFGSGIVIPGTGIALQNRGANFTMNPDAENCVAAGKKSYHTIIPGFLMKDGKPVGPFGVMGGFMQPQGQVQVIMNTIDFHMNPQAALDAPRWQWVGGKTIEVEAEFPADLVEALRERCHDVRVVTDSIDFGRGQIIWRNPETGVLTGATEPRADGTVAVW